MTPVEAPVEVPTEVAPSEFRVLERGVVLQRFESSVKVTRQVPQPDGTIALEYVDTPIVERAPLRGDVAMTTTHGIVARWSHTDADGSLSHGYRPWSLDDTPPAG